MVLGITGRGWVLPSLKDVAIGEQPSGWAICIRVFCGFSIKPILTTLTAPAYSFTPNVPGVYQVILNVYWAGEGIDGAAGQFTSVHFRINGSHYTKIPGIQPNQEYGLEGADDNAIQAPPAVFNIPMNGTGDYMQWYAYNLTGEAPELNFDYSSLSVTRIAGLKTTSRP